MNGSRRLRAGAAAALLVLVAACGGGGGDGGPPGTGGGPAPSPVTAGTCGRADFQAVAMARINAWRARGADCGANGTFGPAPALAWNDRLQQAATAHSQDMVDHDFLSHVGSDGSTFVQRIEAAGYSPSGAGENAAGGYPTIEAVIDGWIGSDGHCATLMYPRFKDVGLACVSGAGTRYGTYWTMDLAAPR